MEVLKSLSRHRVEVERIWIKLKGNLNKTKKVFDCFFIGATALVATDFGVAYALRKLKKKENIDNQELGKEKIKK